MKVCVLGSGSKGNATLVYTDDSALLIDAGFSTKVIEERLSQIDFNPADLDGLLLSHEHSDHIRGVDVLARRYQIPIYATSGTLRKIRGKIRESSLFNAVSSEVDFSIGDIKISPFEIPHDSVDPLGFLLESNGRIAVSLTDIGFVTTMVVEKICKANLAVVESNHELDKLYAGPYPLELKKRIAGRGGHLSNDQCMELLEHTGGNGLSSVIFAHLSEENNDPNIVELNAKSMFANHSIEYEIASQYKVGKVFTV